MAEQYNRAFKGVWISKEIWLAKDLGWSEKLLLVEIDSLDGEQGCFASNDYLASFFGLSKDRVSRMVSSLRDKGYIAVKLHYKEGTKQIEKRIIRVVKQHQHPIGENTDTPRQKHREGLGENTDTPIGENAKDNNTVINNTTNNTKRDIDRQSSVSPVLINQDFKIIQQAFEQSVRSATFKDDQAINEAMEFYETLLILEALKAGASQARSFQYILGILDNWRKEFKVNTYADWQQKIQMKGGQQHATNGQQPNGPHHGKSASEMSILEKLRNYSS